MFQAENFNYVIYKSNIKSNNIVIPSLRYQVTLSLSYLIALKFYCFTASLIFFSNSILSHKLAILLSLLLNWIFILPYCYSTNTLSHYIVTQLYYYPTVLFLYGFTASHLCFLADLPFCWLAALLFCCLMILLKFYTNNIKIVI